VVGDVIGKYHPHGDSAVYDTIVRMAQPFSLRYLLVDGQGNFGSSTVMHRRPCVTPKCAWPYRMNLWLTSTRKRSISSLTTMVPSEPPVLPARLPNLLVNGSSGIAVGMATNIPPHNLGEVISACIALMDNSRHQYRMS
jgi:DNA gyrase subunit A